MLSTHTHVELAHIIDELSHAEIDRIFTVFGLERLLTPPDSTLPKARKVNFILGFLSKEMKGPYSASFQMDVLQYVVNDFMRKRRKIYTLSSETLEDIFSSENPQLANSLKKDGYVVKGDIIKKLLPEEIEEAKIETELMQLLTKFGFVTTKGHLVQAIDNYVTGNWAGANAQFRSFIESLFIEISNALLPQNISTTGAGAIKLLSLSVSPPFLSAPLNEIVGPNCDKPFIDGFWKRLHPQGSHPGLSDEEDSTFRYHMTIVVANNLLMRFEKRK
jgi:hypothetical protein